MVNENVKKTEGGMKSRGRWATWGVAFDHIDEAIKQGFYIEALALEERILVDRLGAAARRVGVVEKVKAGRLSLGGWLKLVEGHPGKFRGLHKGLAKKGLAFGDADAWRRESGRFLRGVARGLPGRESPVTAEAYSTRGIQAAEMGLRLARAVCEWARGEMRNKGDRNIGGQTP